ncbi:MAG TPA: hypothetical protein VGS58_12505, partial [Candidatus Sulfopaludibacter sp.]|nr:hypothetical protein [Candidatus Sulfopaludibacter sp.]
MSPAQLLARIAKGNVPPVVLLLGPEAYQRTRIREALLAAAPEDTVTRLDLSQTTLAEVVDDARSLSLFASERVIWVANAEAALPRGRAAEDDGEGDVAGAGGSGDAAPLAAY